MVNRREGAAAVLAGLAALALPGCAGMGTSTPLPAMPTAPASGGVPVPVSVISFGGGFNLPLWAARDQGFFAAHGIAATLRTTPDSKALFSGLMNGTHHIAVTAFDNIVAYQEGQGEIKFDPPSDFFAFMGSDDGFLSLVAAPEVKTIAELRGKTVSVDAMTNGFSFALREMLARGGLAETDVQWASAGGTDRRYAALVERQHAATMLRAPFDIQAMNRGFNRLATARTAIGPYMGIVGAARRSWAAANPAAVTGFVRAYRDAVRWLELPANRPAAQALLMANVPGMTAELARQSCDLMLDPQTGFFADARLDPQGVRNVLALRSKLAQPPRTLDDPARYIDDRYWRAAQSR